jgi:hypothetical protein
MLWLLSQGHEILGVEISPVAVKNFFSENHLEPRVTDCGTFQNRLNPCLALVFLPKLLHNPMFNMFLFD